MSTYADFLASKVRPCPHGLAFPVEPLDVWLIEGRVSA